MKPLLLAMLLTSIAATSIAEPRVALPSDYRQTFFEYLSLDRVQNPDQFIRLFANEVAMQGRNAQGELPTGSILVAEVYSVKKHQDGSVITTGLGRRIQDRLLLLAVMEKRQGYASTSASSISTGDWDFGAYKPNGAIAQKDLDACRACHAPLTKTDFLFSIEHLPAENH